MKRRIFLRGVAGAALAAPFLSSLDRRSAKAADAAAPKRLVIFYTQNGCIVNRWFPKTENGPVDAAALAGTTLEKLTPFASKLLFPRGLAMFPKGSINGYFDPHDQGMGSKLTAAPIDPANSHWSTGQSLDHFAANLVNPGTKTPLVLSVGNVFSNVKGILSYSAPLTPYPPETKVKNVYSTLTGLFSAGGSMTAADYKVTQGNSILDMVKADLDSFKRLNMSTRDKKKIDDWASLLRQTEQKVVVTAACNASSASALGINDASVKSATSSSLATAFTLGGDMMANLMTLTMMCDANRVLILQWPGFVTFNWDGITHMYDHHGLSHRVGSAAVSGPCVEGVTDMIQQIDNWYAGKFARLVGLIDGVTEGDKTMLDNSAVMWLPELGDGNAHNNTNLPIVIAGSAGGYLKQGVSVNLETKAIGTGDSLGTCQNPGDQAGFNRQAAGGNVPLNKLYVTLLNALGARDSNGQPFTSFGAMDTSDVNKGITNPGELAAIKA